MITTRKAWIKGRKILLACIAMFMMVLALARPACASSIFNVDMTVLLDEEGTAYVTEMRDTAANDGTEWYIVMNNMGSRVVEDFRVQDEQGQSFETLPAWDTDKSMEEKAGKCGILDKGDGDYELCWGIGTYGAHRYTLQYTIRNFVYAHSDADGYHHAFLSSSEDTPIQKFSIRIHKEDTAFDANNSKIWAFGDVAGDIQYNNGDIVVSNAALTQSEANVILLNEFEKGIFQPPKTAQKEEPFEKTIVKAMRGSDYDYAIRDPQLAQQEKVRTISLGIVVAVAIIASAAFFVVVIVALHIYTTRGANATYYKKKYGYTGVWGKKKRDALAYSREIPARGDLTANAWMMRELGSPPNEGEIIGAYLLKWVKEDRIQLQVIDINDTKYAQDQKKKKKKKKKNAEAMKIHLMAAPATTAYNSVERRLFDLLKQAAGDDGILDEDQLKNWAKDHYQDMQAWFEDVYQNGELALQDQNLVEKVMKKGAFDTKQFKILLNDAGYKQAISLFGFKKYLEDFTIINERRAVEVELWEDYLIFAMLFGIAEQVAEEWKTVYPDYFEPNRYNESYSYSYFNMYMVMRATSNMSRAIQYNVDIAARASGGGGGFSGGGGGGFSGGGGGGTR